MNTAPTDEPENTAVMENLQLRPEAKNDSTFLEALHRLTRPDLLQLGLPQTLHDGMVKMQFKAQRSGYRRQFPDAENHIVEKSGEAVGSLIKHVGETAIRLNYIALLPAARGKGYGRRLVAAMQQEAMASGKALRLAVDPLNVPVCTLYLSLGIRIEHKDGATLEMRWQPNNAATGSH